MMSASAIGPHPAWPMRGRRRSADQQGAHSQNLAAIRRRRRVEPVGQRIDAVAEGRRLGLGGGGVVAHAEELDRAEGAVEERALGELVAALARGVDRAGVDEIRVLLPQETWPSIGDLAARSSAVRPRRPSARGCGRRSRRARRESPRAGTARFADVRGRRHVLLHVAHAAVDQHDAALEHVGAAAASPARRRPPCRACAACAAARTRPCSSSARSRGGRGRSGRGCRRCDARSARAPAPRTRRGRRCSRRCRRGRAMRSTPRSSSARERRGERLAVAVDVGYDAVASHRGILRGEGGAQLRSSSGAANGSGSLQEKRS